ncbi:hypothetical protein TMatcc_003321 [Talaromyces marneffei ATCC 18224]|uniref:LysR family regulatory protein n=1 Tax=Talaromyces marneffei (strain ATCC 18224 / CBS 334.59 / QM 7333) TaxID=441960 RepID=B6Q4V8_TALMQ|nr:uncharacterized protein EYB26_001616 [Talaromyces marneffei]EEA28347.1 conserved hypothetical protein [Talaromyces marneffei ATCC 18224]KAE8556018.1 hypothetical protein EYB25_000717 [Talaromyces marneffei]QGA13964.1 hypothetical protein EYB26_001616 [Talaromyces marneffei]
MFTHRYTFRACKQFSELQEGPSMLYNKHSFHHHACKLKGAQSVFSDTPWSHPHGGNKISKLLEAQSGFSNAPWSHPHGGKDNSKFPQALSRFSNTPWFHPHGGKRFSQLHGIPSTFNNTPWSCPHGPAKKFDGNQSASFSVFSRKPTPPPKVESDEVVSLPFFDDTLLLANNVITHMYVYDTVLDAEKLSDSLERLAQRPGWRKMSARVRKNGKGKLEFHIPTEFSETRPAISTTHVKHTTSIADHPIASRFPKPSTTPAVVATTEDFEPLLDESDCPKKLDDYLYKDRSVFGLHIYSFNDATILITHVNHSGLDGIARKDIMDAWLLMLQGREHEILSPCDFHEDPFIGLGKDVSATHRLAERKLSTFALLQWVRKNILDLAWRTPETRLVCLPSGFVEKQRNAAMKELAATQTGSEKPFVSDGDIIIAWLAKAGLSHLPPTSTRNVTIASTFSCRNVLEGSYLPLGKPYLANCAAFFNTLLPVRDITGKSLAYTAQKAREALKEQSSLSQTEAYFAYVRQSTKNKLPPMFGDSNMHFMILSNWTKANLYLIDFSAAAMTPTDKPVTARYMQAVQSPRKAMELFVIIGKDALGNYWLSGSRTKQNWDIIEAALKREDYLFENLPGA